jgi:predicted RNA-binding protein YlxR (DUF448 family)
MDKQKTRLRTCIGCHNVKPKKELIRIILDPDNEYIIKAKRQSKGRGAYLCKNPKGKINKNCLQKAIKRKSFKYAFKKKAKHTKIAKTASSSGNGAC